MYAGCTERLFRDPSTDTYKEEILVKIEYRVALALLAAVGLGSLGNQTLRAQKSPVAYHIGEVFEVSKPDEFSTYAAGVPTTVEKYGGHYLVRGGKTEALEGDPPRRIIVMAFPSMADACRRYNDRRPLR